MTELTTDFIYKIASLRLKARRSYFKLSNSDIAEVTNEDGEQIFLNESYISRIFNNKYTPYKNRRSPNPYLIPKSYVKPLKDNLKFKSEHDMFFGEDWEIDMLAPLLFQKMILDLKTNEKASELIEILLFDSVAYAKAKTYFELLEHELNKIGYSLQTFDNMRLDKYLLKSDELDAKYNHFNQELNYILAIWQKAGIDFNKYIDFKPKNWRIFDFSATSPALKNNRTDLDDKILISKKIEYILQQRINELYFEISLSFNNRIKNFFNSDSLNSFKQLPAKLNEFFDNILISELNDLINQKGSKEEYILHSLGHRVSQIIKNDILPVQKETYLYNLSKMGIFPNENELEPQILKQKQLLLDISQDYVAQLEKYQNRISKNKKRPATLKEWQEAYIKKLESDYSKE